MFKCLYKAVDLKLMFSLNNFDFIFTCKGQGICYLNDIVLNFNTISLRLYLCVYFENEVVKWLPLLTPKRRDFQKDNWTAIA